jgi:ParB family chromosome partitioning protein
VLALRLDEVEEDPDQPRQVFDPDELDRLAAAIRQRGVQAPIIVRPKIGGIYRIVHGARRYRASKLAAQDTIPAIVQADVRRFDGYSQILENLQRTDLTPMEIARFIEKRQTAGDNKGYIAEQLGMTAASVTYHLALLNAAEPVLAAFMQGRVRGAEQVYVLQRQYEKDPVAVERFLESADELTKRMIRDLTAAINGETTQGDKVMTDSPTKEPTSGSTGGSDTHAASASSLSVRGKSSSQEQSDPTRLRRPVLQATYDGQAVLLQLFRRPSSRGYGFVKFEHDGDEEEIELALLSNLTLTDGA